MRAELDLWAAWPCTTYVECCGLDDPQTALDALACLTRYASAEFAIRAFLEQHPVVTFDRLGRREKAPGWVSAELGRQQQGSRELQDQGAGLEVKACWYRLSYAVVSTNELDSTSRRSSRLTPELFRAYQ